MKTIYEALEADHKVLKNLLSELVATEVGTVARRRAVIAVKQELIPHSRAEEAVFYNTLRAIKNEALKELIMGHGYGEHIEAENLLNGLLKEEGDEDLAPEFKKAIEHHIKEEEGEMFTAARQVLLADEATLMGESFIELKSQVLRQGDEQNIKELVMNILPRRFPDNPHHL